MTNHIMQFFTYDHLPPHLQVISKKFCDMATDLDEALDESVEKNVALRKLLESMDAAVRAHLMDSKNRARDVRVKEVKEILYPDTPYNVTRTE